MTKQNSINFDDLFDKSRKTRLKYWLLHKYNFVVYVLPFRIKRFWQRGKYGYSDADTWHLSYYLATIIVAGVKAIRERALGFPNNMHGEEWEEVLQQIEEGFSAALAIMDYYDIDGDSKLLQDKYEKGMQLFSKHFFSLWD